ncbi:MAG TPA: hypothetical protein VGB43_05625, partial [Flavobacterium sp.]
MKKLLLLLCTLSLSVTVNAQSQNFCRTPTTYNNQVSSPSSSSLSVINDSSYCIKVYFHIVQSNGSPGVLPAAVAQAFQILNTDFNPHNIFFQWDNTVDYVNIDELSMVIPDESIFTVNGHTDGVDIYIYPTPSSFFNLAEDFGVPNIIISGSWTDPVFIPTTATHVISHEMGHVLSLFHTHHGTSAEA